MLQDRSHTVPRKSKKDAQPPPIRTSALKAGDIIAPATTAGRPRVSQPLYSTARASQGAEAAVPVPHLQNAGSLPVPRTNEWVTAGMAAARKRPCVTIEEVVDEDASVNTVYHEYEPVTHGNEAGETFDLDAVSGGSESECEHAHSPPLAPPRPSGHTEPCLDINSAASKVYHTLF